MYIFSADFFLTVIVFLTACVCCVYMYLSAVSASFGITEDTGTGIVSYLI